MAQAITPERIGELIDQAPVWAKLALSAGDEQRRTEALEALGRHVYHSLFRVIDVERAQLPLPL